MSVIVLQISWNFTCWLGLPSKELIICFIYKSKILHICDVDVHLDDVSQVAAGIFEDSFKVLDSLSL
jgi:hypothetical protein